MGAVRLFSYWMSEEEGDMFGRKVSGMAEQRVRGVVIGMAL